MCWPDLLLHQLLAALGDVVQASRAAVELAYDGKGKATEAVSTPASGSPTTTRYCYHLGGTQEERGGGDGLLRSS